MSQDIWTVRPVWDGDGYENAPAAADRQAALVDYSLVREIQHRVNAAISEHERSQGQPMRPEDQRQLAMKLIIKDLEEAGIALSLQGQQLMSPQEEQLLRTAVMAAMFGLGRIEALLADDQIEDIYIRGNREVIVKLADGRRELRPPVAESNEDLLAQLAQIATHHGGNNARTVSSARPWLDLRLPGAARLAAIWELTPEPAVTIGRHRYVDITLEKLVGMGTLSAAMVAYLQACVIARRSILVVGGQGAGKTTLLRALCQCIPATTRFATLETEYELLLHELPGRFPGLIPVEARPGTGELDAAGKPAGEVTLADVFPHTLRHSLDLYIFGETRGPEVFPMMQAMARGQRGSMATFHADDAVATFNSLATLMAEWKANWSLPAAMQQISGAIDVIVFIDREEVEDGRNMRYVAEIIEVGPVAEGGQPTVNRIFGPDEAISDIDPRGYPVGKPADQRWPRRAGLDMAWLTRRNGQWNAPFPKRWGME